MSYFGRDNSSGGNLGEMDNPRRFGGLDDKSMGDNREGFDSGRGRRPPFGRGSRGGGPPGNMDRGSFGYGRDNPVRDRSPVGRHDDRFQDRGFPSRDDNPRKEFGRPFPGDDSGRFDGRSGQDGGFKSRFDGPNDMSKRPMAFPPNAPPIKPHGNDSFPKCNECEIIAVNKNQRAYAESVESRIKEIGIIVDMVFLKDEALLTQTIDDMSRKGTLYAMVIGPQNEQHGSVTVNILHGTPQEHRNMPLEDALKLLGRNFHEYVRVQKDKVEREREERGPYKGTVSANKEIQFLLHMLAEGRWVSLPEMNTVLRYLTERRDKMSAGASEEGGAGRALPPISDLARGSSSFKPKDDDDKAKKEQDLQDRIIKLMNQGAPTSSLGDSGPNLDISSSRPNQSRLGPGAGIKSHDDNLPKSLGSTNHPDSRPSFTSPNPGAGQAANSAAPNSTYINFDNDSVQKALDNLMSNSSNLLKNISMNNKSLTDDTGAATSALPGLGIGPSSDRMGMQPGNVPRGGLNDLPPSSGGMGDHSDRGSGDMGMGRGTGGSLGGFGQGQRGPGTGAMNISQSSAGYGNLSDAGGLGNQRSGYAGSTSMGAPGLASRGMQDLGRMGGNAGNMAGSDLGRPGGYGSGTGSNFQNQGGNFMGQSQYNRYPTPGQQQSFNSGMGNVNRPNFGGGQGMGGPRRY